MPRVAVPVFRALRSAPCVPRPAVPPAVLQPPPGRLPEKSSSRPLAVSAKGPPAAPGRSTPRASGAGAHIASNMASMPIPIDSRHARATSGWSPQPPGAVPPDGAAAGTSRAPVSSTYPVK